ATPAVAATAAVTTTSASAAASSVTAATAAVASAATAVAAATTVATAAARTILTGPRFVDRQSAPPQFIAIHSFDGGLCFVVVRHLHETEAARAPGFTVLDDGGLFDGTEFLERLPQLLFGRSVREITYIDVHDS